MIGITYHGNAFNCGFCNHSKEDCRYLNRINRSEINPSRIIKIDINFLLIQIIEPMEDNIFINSESNSSI